MEHRIDGKAINDFKEKMLQNERAEATIEKYMRDLEKLRRFARDEPVTKTQVIRFKQNLMEKYTVSSVNSILAAVNSFFREMGWYDCIVRSVRVQGEAFRSSDRELTKQEYDRLLDTALKQKKRRLYYVMQTLCSTGIRISELKFITVESLASQRVTVSLKGKTRIVLLPKALCRQLKKYIKERHINSGPIFVTRSGRPLDRSNVYHEMKKLSRKSNVEKTKIFPHNLRHLFACVFYQKIKNLPQLADILGHSNVNTTRIYTKISCEQQVRQIDMLKLVV